MLRHALKVWTKPFLMEEGCSVNIGTGKQITNIIQLV